jgi:hypothetical protein
VAQGIHIRFAANVNTCHIYGDDNRCVFQMSSDKSQSELIASNALDCGFSGGMIVDHPNSSSQRKMYLVLLAGERSNAMLNRDPTIGRLALNGDPDDINNDNDMSALLDDEPNTPNTPPLTASNSSNQPPPFTLARVPASPPAGGTIRPSTVAVAATTTAGMPTWLSVTAAQPSSVLFAAPSRYIYINFLTHVSLFVPAY